MFVFEDEGVYRIAMEVSQDACPWRLTGVGIRGDNGLSVVYHR